jgi:hypothetical protein
MANDYKKLVESGKKNNPGLFNNPEKLRIELKKMDKIVNESTDLIAKSIDIQTRNVLAFALGEELLDEEEIKQEIERRYNV